MALVDQIKKLTQQLLPSGRVFWIKLGSYYDKYIDALNESEARAVADAKSILDSAIPDNDNFSADDAAAWEKRLGLITNELVPLADRKLAIRRKMNHPGDISARQNYRYLEGQLQAAGFDVFVHENRFPTYPDQFTTKTPDQFSLYPFPVSYLEHSEDLEHGEDVEHGGDFGNKIVNYMEEALDNDFNVGVNYRSTFFIGGQTPGTWAIVDVNREAEFRQLVLRIKPSQTVAFILIHFY